MDVPFGVAYRLAGGLARQPVPHRFVVTFPPGGMTNPKTGKHADNASISQMCRVGEECHAGFIFKESWEMLPGLWRIEVFVGTERVISEALTVVQ